MEPISQTIATNFVLGVILGIIDEINKKAITVIWILAVIWTVCSFFIQGPADYASGLGWGVWNWITMVITVTLSFMIGKIGCKGIKDAFEKENDNNKNPISKK
jgi:hypothetical protein